MATLEKEADFPGFLRLGLPCFGSYPSEALTNALGLNCPAVPIVAVALSLIHDLILAPTLLQAKEQPPRCGSLRALLNQRRHLGHPTSDQAFRRARNRA